MFFVNRPCMFYKTVNQTMALDIPQYLHKPQIATRSFHQNYFIPIQTNSDVYKFSYFPRTVRFWNLLPSIVVTASSIAQLKNNLWKQINNGSITLVQPYTQGLRIPVSSFDIKLPLKMY